MFVCLKYCLPGIVREVHYSHISHMATYERTLEKSAEGDMTKLSALEDHDIRCWMLESSSMLFRTGQSIKSGSPCLGGA